MNEFHDMRVPELIPTLIAEAEKLNFQMSCDELTGTLLRTLVSSKIGGNILELGTGVGVSTCWILDGMDKNSRITSVEYDERLHTIAAKYLSNDVRVNFVTMDGAEFIQQNQAQKYDFIFADTWPGKFNHLAETLNMLAVGGIYLIDDLNQTGTWPEGHQFSVDQLIGYLEQRDDLHLTKLNWSTGIMIVTRK